MFEYLNYGALSVFGLFGFILFITNLLNNKEKFTGLYLLLFILIGLVLLDAYNKHTTALKNISDFKNKNITLKCVSGGGLYTSADTYRVSINDGWRLDKDYFIKDSFMVRANNCESWN